MYSMVRNRTFTNIFVKCMSTANIGNQFQPTKFQRKILVWTKMYKSMEEIPKNVSADTFDRARNKFRIKVSNILMLLTVFGCIGCVISGKRAARRGESVEKRNIDWHKEYNENYNKQNSIDK